MLYVFLLTKILLSLLGHSENKPGKIRLAKKYFQDAELIWSKTFEGKMIDFEIAKKSGHVVIATWKEMKAYVHSFTIDGELLWEKNSIEHSMFHEGYATRLSISDSAETTGILWLGGYESIETQVYDINGKLISSHKYGASLEVSPKGGYIDISHLYKKTGERIVLREILKGFPIEKLKRKRGYGYKNIKKYALVSENEIGVLFDNILHFYSFPEGDLKWQSKELGSRYGKIIPLERHILVIREKKLYCFSKDGRLKWEKGLRFNYVTLSSNKKYLAIHTGWSILVLDIKTGEAKLQSSKLKSQFGVFSLLYLNNRIFLSGGAGSLIKDVHKGYWTFILQFDDNWNIIDESYERGLVLGTSTSPVIVVYESDATGESDNTSIAQYENSNVFTINALKIRN